MNTKSYDCMKEPCNCDLAYRSAISLANSMWRRHYRERAPHWKPLPDLVGVISQISNMAAGLLTEIEQLKSALNPANDPDAPYMEDDDEDT